MADEEWDAKLKWSGIEIDVRFKRNWLNGSAHHLELRVCEPLPVTDTGYRSHFFPVEFEVDDANISAFVIEWLDECSLSKDWQDYLERQRQGDLFDL